MKTNIKEITENNEKPRYLTTFSSDICCGYIPGSPECKTCPDLRHCPKRDMIELAEMFARITKHIRSVRRY